MVKRLGLKPGRFTIRLFQRGWIDTEFTIPPGVSGLYDMGEVKILGSKDSQLTK